jgi:DNA-binding transcriptional MerR regulator
MEIPFFGKKSGKGGAEEARGRGYVPTDRAAELMGRGFSEIDTIDVLRREGFSPSEIDNALEQSIKQGVTGTPRTPSTSAQQSAPAGSMGSDGMQGFQSLGNTYEQFQQGPAPTFPPRKEQSAAQGQQPERERTEFKLPTIEELGGKSQPDALAVPETSLPDEYYQGYPTEEYIDYVVQEQMQDVNERIGEFTVRQKEMEKKMTELNERMKEVSTMRSGDQQQIMSKIDSFSDTINDVNVRIASLEKAFKEMLPALIESVRALSDIVQRMKREA